MAEGHQAVDKEYSTALVSYVTWQRAIIVMLASTFTSLFSVEFNRHSANYLKSMAADCALVTPAGPTLVTKSQGGV